MFVASVELAIFGIMREANHAARVAVFCRHKRKPHEVALSNEMRQTQLTCRYCYYTPKLCYNKGIE